MKKAMNNKEMNEDYYGRLAAGQFRPNPECEACANLNAEIARLQDENRELRQELGK